MTMNSSDAWMAGAAYEAYMGRWSRPLARLFLEWLQPMRSAHWLEIGCGTGALTSSIADLCEPASVIACDPSAAFIEHARKQLSDGPTSLLVASADDLPHRDSGFDAIVSGLVLNFLPDPGQVLASIRERLRPSGVVAAYVWDYAEGMEFLRRFWDVAAAVEARAAALDEAKRFPLCRRAALESLFRAAGLTQVRTESLEVTTEFADFDDYWEPFLSGTGPAPSYVVSLNAVARGRLRDQLEQRLAPDRDGRIRLRARAWAVRGELSGA
jgi:SAM-dependent methyltransferase